MVRVIPLVVILCLVFSLFESLFVLPAHLGHAGSRETRGDNPVTRPGGASRAPSRPACSASSARSTGPLLESLLEWRYLTVPSGRDPADHAGHAGRRLDAVRLPARGRGRGGRGLSHHAPGYAGGGHRRGGGAADPRRRGRAARGRRGARYPGSVFAHVFDAVGEQPYRVAGLDPRCLGPEPPTGGHLGEVQIEVVQAEERSISVEELTRRWRERTGRSPVPWSSASRRR